MLSTRFAFIIATVVLLGGCATRQEVLLTKASGAKSIATVVHMAEDGNSKEMDAFLRAALEKEGVQVKATAPLGAQKTKQADAVVSYIDVWRWDIAMYLRSLTVRIFDGETGDLLIVGNWADSPLHGFRDPKTVFDGVIKDMLARLNAAARDK
jgi:glucose-6-phosphate dehydrogenase assembly protein OpcA